jgi:hypothetical protein
MGVDGPIRACMHKDACSIKHARMYMFVGQNTIGACIRCKITIRRHVCVCVCVCVCARAHECEYVKTCMRMCICVCVSVLVYASERKVDYARERERKLLIGNA